MLRHALLPLRPRGSLLCSAPLRARGTIVALAVASLGLGSAGCKDDGGGGLGVDARWQLRCPTPAGGCLNQRPAHAVSAREGDSDAVVSCEIIDIGENQRAIFVEAAQASGSLEVEGLVVNFSGGVLDTAGCQVTIEEDGVIFGPHHCGPNAPSSEQPCQVTTVALNPNGSLVLDDGTISGPTLSTTIYCPTIQDEGAAETRQLVSPDSPPPNLMPAPISVVNCPGF